MKRAEIMNYRDSRELKQRIREQQDHLNEGHSKEHVLDCIFQMERDRASKTYGDWGVERGIGTSAVAVVWIMLDRYDPERDGDLYEYLKWYLNSATVMILGEMERGKGKIMQNPWIFFSRIHWMFIDFGPKETSQRLGIEQNRRLMEKAIQVDREEGCAWEER